jgi:N-acetylmuramoyl-L-alanine amidase
MTNKSELAYMNSEKGQNAYARMLCNAVKEYVGHINRLAGVTTEMAESSEPEVQEVEQPKSKEESKVEPKSVTAEEKNAEKTAVKEGYTIQLLASDKRVKATDSQFKSYRGKVACYEGGGKLKYKYCYGNFSTRAEAQRKLSEVRRLFKDAFVVHYNGDKIVK